MCHRQPVRGRSRHEDVQWLQLRVVDIEIVDARCDRGQQPVCSLVCREAFEMCCERRYVRGLRDVVAVAVQLIGRLTAMAGRACEL
jgi:hypothetical protein